VAEPLREISPGPRPPGLTPRPVPAPPPPPAGPASSGLASSALASSALASSGLASEAPRREAGTRSRAGNAMARTRAGLLDGALRAVARQGTRRATMNDIASAAGVAKATLYNHFRTKNDVWHALVEAQLTELAADCAELELTGALALAANRVSTHPALRRIAAGEPGVLAAILTAGPDAPGWRQAREAVRLQLAASGLGGTDLVLRWLVSHIAAPAEPDAVARTAECIVGALPSGADPG
jgi:AcrR family transcriptional regulator